MANYLRPKRGRKSTAIQQHLILKKGEVFFECPDSGMGTGLGNIKIGDGRTQYEDLPYFFDHSYIPAEDIEFDTEGTDFESDNIEGVIKEVDTKLKSIDESIGDINESIGLLREYVNEIINEKLDGKKFKIMTLAEYEVLPESQKTNDTIFMCMKDPEE